MGPMAIASCKCNPMHIPKNKKMRDEEFGTERFTFTKDAFETKSHTQQETTHRRQTNFLITAVGFYPATLLSHFFLPMNTARGKKCVTQNEGLASNVFTYVCVCVCVCVCLRALDTFETFLCVWMEERASSGSRTRISCATVLTLSVWWENLWPCKPQLMSHLNRNAY